MEIGDFMPECCKSCGSIDLKETVMPDGYVHYARIDCRDCGKFVKWGKKPEKQDMQEKNKYTGGHGSMNIWSGMGRLTKDPELRYTSNNNTANCSFMLAVDRDFQKEGAEKEADFIPCIIWEKKGENAAKYLEKGRRIGVVGRIQTRNWDDNEGKKHYVTEVIVQNWYFADDKKKEGTSSAQGQQQSASAEKEKKDNTPPPDNQQQTTEEDLPPWLRK
jgi:single-strand DNA-binding protein